MKIITTTHYNRPDCTRKMLQRFTECIGIKNYKILAFIEPVCPEIPEIFEQFSDQLNIRMYPNKSLLGCWDNKKKAVETGFQHNDYIIHVEDDVMLARDALQFFEFCDKSYRDNPAVFSATAYNTMSERHFRHTVCYNCKCIQPFYEIEKRRWFTSSSFAGWKHKWPKEWSGEDIEINKVHRGEMYEMFPVLSRAQNIGYTKGVCSSDEVIRAILDSGNSPIKWNVTTGNWELDTSKDIPENEDGHEWMKLAEGKCRTKFGSQRYKDAHTLDFWYDNIAEEVPNGMFYDHGRIRYAS